MGIYDTRTSCKKCGECYPVSMEGVCIYCRGDIGRRRLPPVAKVLSEPKMDEWSCRSELHRAVVPYDSFVYIAHRKGDVYKIGFSDKSVKLRVKVQGLKLLFVLNTINGRAVEKALHARFESQRVAGWKEYFVLGYWDVENLRHLSEVDGNQVKVITSETDLLVFVP